MFIFSAIKISIAWMCFYNVSVGYSDSYIDLNWRHTRAIILKAIEMPQFSLSEEVHLEDFTETYESEYRRSTNS